MEVLYYQVYTRIGGVKASLMHKLPSSCWVEALYVEVLYYQVYTRIGGVKAGLMHKLPSSCCVEALYMEVTTRCICVFVGSRQA